MAKYSIFTLVGVILLLGIGEVVDGDPQGNNPFRISNDISAAEGAENKDLILTLKQKTMLAEFKKRVINRLPHDYMKEDVYLIRWLRGHEFDMKSAEEALMENLRWRKELKVDTIQNEDFSDVTADYPVYIDTFTKSGRPVVTAIAGQWDIRGGILTGRNKRTIRFIIQFVDKAARMVREAQNAGKNITRFDIILSLDGFSLIQHACPRCIFDMIEVMRIGEKYFPELYDRVTVINTPAYIISIFEPIIRSTVTSGTLSRIDLKLLGTNKNDWRRYFLQYIDEDMLPEEFGGRRVRDE